MHRASCAKGQDGGGVNTSSDPAPPLPTGVFLNFLVGIWSGTDVEIAVIGPTVASAAAAGAFSLPSRAPPRLALLLGRCWGHILFVLTLQR